MHEASTGRSWRHRYLCLRHKASACAQTPGTLLTCVLAFRPLASLFSL